MKKKPDLSALKQAGSKTIERISAHCPAAGQQELQKLYAASERKYLARKQDSGAAADSEMFSVGVEKHFPIWKRTWAAAACLLVCAGTAGGMFILYRNPAPTTEDLHIELDTTQKPTEKEADAETAVSEEAEHQPFSEKSEVGDPENSYVSDAVVQDQTETASVPDSSGADALSVRKTPPAVTEPDTTEPKETTPAETEPEFQFTPAEYGNTYTAENEIPEIPGFRVSDKRSDTTWLVLPESKEGDSQILTRYAPAYVPDGFTAHISRNAAVDVKYNRGGVVQIERYYTSESSGKDISVIQYCRGQYTDYILHSDDTWMDYDVVVTITSLTIEGKPGYLCVEETLFSSIRTTLVWDRGDYIFEISGYDLPEGFADEMVKMAETLEPAGNTAYDGDISMEYVLPSLPGFRVVEATIPGMAPGTDTDGCDIYIVNEEAPGFYVFPQWTEEMPELVTKRYYPSYIPDTLQREDFTDHPMTDPDEEFLKDLAAEGGSTSYAVYLERVEPYEDVYPRYQNITIYQLPKWRCVYSDCFDSYVSRGVPLTSVTAGEYQGYQRITDAVAYFEGKLDYELYLDVGDYYIWIYTYAIDPDEIGEILKMAASMQCID